MNDLSSMVWVELRKALRSRIPLWTAIGSLAMPLGIAFLIYVARNPEVAQNAGLISAKANLMAYAATDWPTYLGLMSQIIAVGGFFLFVLIISWVFGREFADGTVKDLLAVPVQRFSILLAKFIVTIAWCGVLALIILIAGMITGALIQLPGWEIGVVSQQVARMAFMTCMTITVTLPFALVASVGRGYLLPMGVIVLLLIMTNVVALAGWGEYFPWAVPMLSVQAKSPLALFSYAIVFLTGVAGMLATYLWWKWADQSR